MSISTVKPLACRIPPVAGGNDSLSRVSKVKMVKIQAHLPLQVKGKEKSDTQERLSSATSRREMMQLTAATVGLLSLMLPPAAEAAARNATMRQKIMEKFEELRQKAGLSKPKDEGEDKKPKDEKEGKSKVESSTTKDEGEDKKPKDEKEGKSKVESRTKEAKPQAKAEGEAKKVKDESHGKANAETDTKEGVAVIPALPGIINGTTVEITLP